MTFYMIYDKVANRYLTHRDFLGFGNLEALAIFGSPIDASTAMERARFSFMIHELHKFDANPSSCDWGDA